MGAGHPRSQIKKLFSNEHFRVDSLFFFSSSALRVGRQREEDDGRRIESEREREDISLERETVHKFAVVRFEL